MTKKYESGFEKLKRKRNSASKNYSNKFLTYS